MGVSSDFVSDGLHDSGLIELVVVVVVDVGIGFGVGDGDDRRNRSEIDDFRNEVLLVMMVTVNVC